MNELCGCSVRWILTKTVNIGQVLLARHLPFVILPTVLFFDPTTKTLFHKSPSRPYQLTYWTLLTGRLTQLFLGSDTGLKQVRGSEFSAPTFTAFFNPLIPQPPVSKKSITCVGTSACPAAWILTAKNQITSAQKKQNKKKNHNF